MPRVWSGLSGGPLGSGVNLDSVSVLVEDSPAFTSAGRRLKRRVVVHPPRAATGLRPARAEGPGQTAAIGRQAAGRVGFFLFFLRADDFGRDFARLVGAGVRLASEPRTGPYGRIAVFLDISGNRWDLLG